MGCCLHYYCSYAADAVGCLRSDPYRFRRGCYFSGNPGAATALMDAGLYCFAENALLAAEVFVQQSPISWLIVINVHHTTPYLTWLENLHLGR